MEKITYTNVNGRNISNLSAGKTYRALGLYGRMARDYMKANQPFEYEMLIMEGTEHDRFFLEIEEQALDYETTLFEQLREANPQVDEERDFMKKVALLENLKSQAVEMTIKAVIEVDYQV